MSHGLHSSHDLAYGIDRLRCSIQVLTNAGSAAAAPSVSADAAQAAALAPVLFQVAYEAPTTVKVWSHRPFTPLMLIS